MPPGRLHRALPVPRGDQRVQSRDVAVGQRGPGRAEFAGPPVQHPGADRVGQRRESRHSEPAGRRLRVPPPGPPIGPAPPRQRRPAARCGRGWRPPPGRESTSGPEQSPGRGPSIARVGVVRVLPDRQVLGEAGRSGLRPRHVEQWSYEQDPVPAPPYRHSREAARAGTAHQREQHRLGLVVPGVAEQHGRGTVLVRRRGQRLVPRVPGRCLRPTGPVSRHRPPSQRPG